MCRDSVGAASLFLVMVCCNAGSGADGASALGTVPSCSSGPPQAVVKVQGTLAGQSINVDQTPAPGMFSQVGTGQFDLPIYATINDAAIGADPGSVQIHLKWSGLVPNGGSADATGTIVLSGAQPYAQMSLCAGSGSRIAPDDPNNGIDFVLEHLTLGPACTQAVAGELRGCWGYGSD